MKILLKCLLFGAALVPAMIVALGTLAIVGLGLAMLNLLLLHAVLGQPLLSTEKPWERGLMVACIVVSVGCGLAKMLGWWWADLKRSPDPDVRALAESLELRWELGRRALAPRPAPQVLAAPDEEPANAENGDV